MSVTFVHVFKPIQGKRVMMDNENRIFVHSQCPPCCAKSNHHHHHHGLATINRNGNGYLLSFNSISIHPSIQVRVLALLFQSCVLLKELREVENSSEASTEILSKISRSLSTGSSGVSTHLSKSLRLA